VSYRVESLADSHDLRGFTCGKPELDTWLQDHASRAMGQGTRTYVLIEDASESVAGYFAIAPHLLSRDDAPRRMSRSAPTRIPAILLAKLALHARIQGKGLGGDLLVQAFATIVAAARSAGGRLIVVDAIDDDAAAFYRAHDFEPTPTNPHRLLIRISTAARALGAPWP
jgi:GNAT superfamily N-acetyltransferase